MGLRNKGFALGVVACVGLVCTACSDGHSAPAAEHSSTTNSPTAPAAHAEVALYNDTANSVRVIGCVDCGASGTPLLSGRSLFLNMPADKMRLTIERPTTTTCFMVLNGVDTGKPLQLKVSHSVASAC